MRRIPMNLGKPDAAQQAERRSHRTSVLAEESLDVQRASQYDAQHQVSPLKLVDALAQMKERQ
jgi:hypothetical protein